MQCLLRLLQASPQARFANPRAFRASYVTKILQGFFQFPREHCFDSAEHVWARRRKTRCSEMQYWARVTKAD